MPTLRASLGAWLMGDSAPAVDPPVDPRYALLERFCLSLEDRLKELEDRMRQPTTVPLPPPSPVPPPEPVPAPVPGPAPVLRYTAAQVVAGVRKPVSVTRLKEPWDGSV